MITTCSLTKRYGSGDGRAEVLKGIDIEIEDGSFTVILGASGSGKSTLLNIISGLERPDGGNVMYGEKDITALTDSELTKFRKENVGLVFQQYYLLPDMTVEKNVRMGADLADNTEFSAISAAVGLESKAKKIPLGALRRGDAACSYRTGAGQTAEGTVCRRTDGRARRNDRQAGTRLHSKIAERVWPYSGNGYTQPQHSRHGRQRYRTEQRTRNDNLQKRGSQERI